MPFFLLSLAALAQAPAMPARDWAETLRTDARAMHDAIAANHPGPVNALDPDFAKRNDAALALALKRAARVRDYAGYLAAMRGYAASFDDGHLSVSPTDAAPPVAYRWPGFLTGYDGDGRQVVRTRADAAPVPLGAVLQGCDGTPADALARQRVGAFWGRWFLPSMRQRFGWRLFADTHNPFVALPQRCMFRVDGRASTVSLAWRPLTDSERAARVAEVNHGVRLPIGARTLADGTRWFTLSGFDGDPDSADAKALAPLIEAMRRQRAEIVKAPRIVLDLRGNNGGSSDWSAQIAEILWGKQRVEAVEGSDGVDWRASPANLKTLRDYAEMYARTADASDWVLPYFERLVSGMEAALEAGEPLYREVDPAEPPTPGSPPAPPAGPVYFVTGPSCASACLDAADLWKALGAIQLGRETSADTLYMDLRRDVLPSGLMRLSVPMKVYRGRPRGSNEPLRPVHRYPGDMRDTEALAAWIAALPENR